MGGVDPRHQDANTVFAHTKFKEDTPTALEVQVGGSHYKELDIQPIEYILANNLGYAEGNVVKYVTRYSLKNGKEDLEKARHYIDLLLEQRYPNSAAE